jgi:hypothetical protein
LLCHALHFLHFPCHAMSTCLEIFLLPHIGVQVF